MAHALPDQPGPEHVAAQEAAASAAGRRPGLCAAADAPRSAGSHAIGDHRLVGRDARPPARSRNRGRTPAGRAAASPGALDRLPDRRAAHGGDAISAGALAAAASRRGENPAAAADLRDGPCAGDRRGPPPLAAGRPGDALRDRPPGRAVRRLGLSAGRLAPLRASDGKRGRRGAQQAEPGPAARGVQRGCTIAVSRRSISSSVTARRAT